jgi:hypothetical protein
MIEEAKGIDLFPYVGNLCYKMFQLTAKKKERSKVSPAANVIKLFCGCNF